MNIRKILDDLLQQVEFNPPMNFYFSPYDFSRPASKNIPIYCLKTQMYNKTAKQYYTILSNGAPTKIFSEEQIMGPDHSQKIIDLSDDLVHLLKLDSSFENVFNDSNNDDLVNYVRPNTIVIEQSGQVPSQETTQNQTENFFGNNITLFVSAESNAANKNSESQPECVVDMELKHHLDIKFAGFK